MIIGKVVGSIIATRKNANLVGQKLMLVKPVNDDSTIVAIDNGIGAGIGEIVIVAQGSAARIGCGLEKAPVDVAIVGIVDDECSLDFLNK